MTQVNIHSQSEVFDDLKFELISQDSISKQIKFIIPSEIIHARVQTRFQLYQKQAHVDGFRVGHAPLALVMRDFKKPVYDEVQDALVSQSLSFALEKLSLNPIGECTLLLGEKKPLISEKGFSFTIAFEVMPNLEILNYKDLCVARPEVLAVTIEELEEKIASMDPSEKPEELDAAWRESIQVSLMEERVAEADHKFDDAIFDQLIECNPDIKMPRAILIKEFEEYCKQLLNKAILCNQGLTQQVVFEMLEHNQALIFADVERRMKILLILSACALKESLKVSPEELDEALESVSDEAREDQEYRISVEALLQRKKAVQFLRNLAQAHSH